MTIQSRPSSGSDVRRARGAGQTIRAEHGGFGDFIAIDVPKEEDANMATRKENGAATVTAAFYRLSLV